MGKLYKSCGAPKYKFARNKNQQELIEQHIEMIMNAAEKTFSDKRDLEDMKKRFTSLKKSG